MQPCAGVCVLCIIHEGDPYAAVRACVLCIIHEGHPYAAVRGRGCSALFMREIHMQPCAGVGVPAGRTMRAAVQKKFFLVTEVPPIVNRGRSKGAEMDRFLYGGGKQCVHFMTYVRVGQSPLL